MLAVILAATDMALGAVYILEPHARALGPALAGARELWPIWIWGLIVLAFGFTAVIEINNDRHPTLSMSAGAGWHVVFTGGVIWSAFHQPAAGLGGCVIFFSFTVLHLLAARQR